MIKHQEWIEAVERAVNAAYARAQAEREVAALDSGRLRQAKHLGRAQAPAADAARLTELAAYLRADGWQDIESAPKDGAHILGINSNKDQAVIYWNGVEWVPSFVTGDRESAAKMWNDSSCAFWSGYAKAWRPLPPPPRTPTANCDDESGPQD